MDPIAANQADIGLALQPGKGQIALAAQHRVFLTGGGLGPIRETAEVEETTSARVRSRSYVTQVRAEGTPQCVVMPDYVGLVLFGVLGAKAVGAAVGGVYPHTFTPDVPLPWLTGFRSLGGIIFEKFPDCRITRARFSSDSGGLLLVEFDVLGLTYSFLDEIDDAVAVEEDEEFVHADGKNALLIEGAADRTVESWSVEINNNASLQQGDDIGGYTVATGGLDVTYTARTLIEDADLWNRYMYGDATPAVGDGPTRDILRLTSGVDFLFTRPGTPARSLRFTSTEVKLAEQPGGYEPDPDLAGILKQELTLKARQPDAGDVITSILRNGKSSYPAAATA